ncbi:hypothetical protein BDD12DRAFT_984238 [Trichophaea hybrida]|nr:hypothetical protein BDD12DRAFT_984238 [Trichophaea hybrida]
MAPKFLKNQQCIRLRFQFVHPLTNHGGAALYKRRNENDLYRLIDNLTKIGLSKRISRDQRTKREAAKHEQMIELEGTSRYRFAKRYNRIFGAIYRKNGSFEPSSGGPQELKNFGFSKTSVVRIPTLTDERALGEETIGMESLCRYWINQYKRSSLEQNKIKILKRGVNGAPLKESPSKQRGWFKFQQSPAISTAETRHVGEIPAEIFEVQIPGAWPAWSEAKDNSENSESDSDLEGDATVIGYKDRELAALPVTIGQPVNGWQEAKNLLSGKALKLDTPGACWTRKNRAKMQVAKDKEKQDALRNIYGSIARFFVPVIPAAPHAVLRSSGSRFIAPDFDEPESQDLEKEMANDIEQLEMWLKKNKPDLTTPWGKRIDSLLR